MALEAAKTLAELNPATAALKEGVDAVQGGFDKLVDSIRSQVVQYEQYRISLTLATGANAKFVDQIRSEAYELGKYGVTFQNLVKINEDIAKSYSQATFSAAQTRADFESQRKEVEKLIAVNDKFGASTDQTIGLLNKLGNSVYNNVEQVGKFSDSLLKFSRETGQSFGNVLKEFGTYSDRFITAISSDKATQSFATLELLARRSGTEVGKLVGSIQKFDDIDEAFSTGGQLNRVLSYFGGSFDTLAAANASDEERAQMLIKSISSIGDKFNQVSNPQARRSMLKELERSSGLPMEMITGLLNKSNKLSEDLTAIMRTPVEVKPSATTYTDAEKKAMAMEVTDIKTVAQIKEESLKMGTTISMIEKVIAANKAQYVSTVVETGKQLDKAAGKLLKEGKLAEAVGEVTTAATKLKDSMMTSGGFMDSLKKALSGQTGALTTYAQSLSKEGQTGDKTAMSVYTKQTREIEATKAKDLVEQKKQAEIAAQKRADMLAERFNTSIERNIGKKSVTFNWTFEGKKRTETFTFAQLLSGGGK